MVSGLGSWLVYRQLVIRTLGPGCPRVRYRVMFGQEVVPQVDGYLGAGADEGKNEQTGSTE